MTALRLVAALGRLESKADIRQARRHSAQDTIKLGMVMPLTGPLATAGQQVVAGARLYISQHGDKVAGKRIELIVRDDASSPDNGKRLIQEAIVNDKVDIIGGGTTADLLGRLLKPKSPP
jgi:branched-chain amino acid transport system substrate-binding protein